VKKALAKALGAYRKHETIVGRKEVDWDTDLFGVVGSVKRRPGDSWFLLGSREGVVKCPFLGERLGRPVVECLLQKGGLGYQTVRRPP